MYEPYYLTGFSTRIIENKTNKRKEYESYDEYIRLKREEEKERKLYERDLVTN